MTPSLFASARRRPRPTTSARRAGILSRLSLTVVAAVATTLTLAALTLPAAAPAAATAGTAPAVAPRAGATTATDDASDVTLAVAPAAGGVVTPGQALAVSLSARNSTGSTLPAAGVRLSSSTRPLSTRAEVRAWLDTAPADAARTELAVASGDMPAVAPLAVGAMNLSVDAAALTGLTPGVYPLRADYGTGDGSGSTVTAVSVIVVPGDAGTGALGVIVPITASPISEGLLTATELAELTAPDGALRARLDAVAGTAAILAIDPAVVAAIRVLGTSAPPSATAWLADLMQLPNSRFALQFGDADLATQVAAGLAAPLSVSSLASYLTASNFAGVTPTATPGAAELDANPDPAATPTASAAPTPTTAPGGPTLPTLAQLTDIGAASGSVFWPASGTADATVVSALGALTVDDLASITLVDSASTTPPSSTAGATAPAWATAGASRVLVYDTDASHALAVAAGSEVPITRAAALAEASAFAALAVAADPTAPLLVTLDRPADVSATGTRASVVAATHLAGRTGVDLGTLTAGTPPSVGIVDTAADATPGERAPELTSLLADEEVLTSFATILTDPTVLTSPERAAILQLLSVGWNARPTQAAAALSSHRTQTQKTLDSVAVVPPSDITLAATSAPLTFSVRNDLAWPVSLRLIATPNDPRLIVQDTTEVQAGPEQSTRVQVPVQARVGSGESTLSLQLRSPSMVAIGESVPVHVTVRAEWESVGLIVMSTLIAAMIVIGVVRTVRKLRRRKKETDA